MSNTPEPSADPIEYPLLPLRDVVVFPHMVIPLFVGRPKSIRAMEIAMEAGKSILLVAQKSAAKDEPSEDKKEPAAPAVPPALAAPPLKESSATSTLMIIADTDWLLDDVIFSPQARQQGMLVPMNDNLDLAGNALDFLAGSDELLSIRGKGAAVRPFQVVQEMEATALNQFNARLTALESRLGDVQSKLSSLQAKRTDSGRLVASPEMQAEINRFEKDRAAIRLEQREIRRTLREDVNKLGRDLLWVNLLTTPLLVGVFGFWFARARRR